MSINQPYLFQPYLLQPYLVAIGYAVWTDGAAHAGAFTLAPRSQIFDPSLADLLAMALPAAGLRPRSPAYKDLRASPSPVFLSFPGPNTADSEGMHPAAYEEADYEEADHEEATYPASSPSLPNCLRRPVLLPMSIPFSRSRAYSLDLVLLDPAISAGDFAVLEKIAFGHPLPLLQLSAAEKAHLDLLLHMDPDRLVRYAALRAELTLVLGSGTLANSLP